MTMTVDAGQAAHEVLRDGAKRLRAAGVDSADAEAGWLLGHLLHVNPVDLHVYEGRVPADVAARFAALIGERAAGTPLQYLTGEAGFFGRIMRVAPGVFIPRPETEHVLAAFIERLRRRPETARPLRLLDLGTGSGCLAVTLACEVPACVVVGLEVSWTALCAARVNARRYGVSSRIQFIRGEWVRALRTGAVFDGIIANPPYIPSASVDRLPLDVRQEPRESLDGGVDGLRDLRELLAEASRLLAPGGVMALECGEEQVADVLCEARVAPWVGEAHALHDLAGRPRGILIARRHG